MALFNNDLICFLPLENCKTSRSRPGSFTCGFYCLISFPISCDGEVLTKLALSLASFKLALWLVFYHPLESITCFLLYCSCLTYANMVLISALSVDCWEYEFTWCICRCQGIVNPDSFFVHGIIGIFEFETQRIRVPILRNSWFPSQCSTMGVYNTLSWRELEVGFGYILLLHESSVLLVT